MESKNLLYSEQVQYLIGINCLRRIIRKLNAKDSGNEVDKQIKNKTKSNQLWVPDFLSQENVVILNK